MWFWQQSVPKNISLWSKIAAVAAFMHGMVLFLVLFVYRGYGEYHIDVVSTMLDHQATVVLMPLHKKVSHPVAVKPSRKEQNVAPAVQESVAIAPKSEGVQQPVPATTALVQERPVVKKPIIQKTRAKKRKQHSHERQKKFVVEPVVQKMPVAPDVKPEPMPLQDNQTQNVSQNIEAMDNDVLYVGRAQLEALQMQTEIQQEVERRWKPPVGLSKELLCYIRVTIDWQGVVQKAYVEKPSGVLIYDVHARNAAREIVFPKTAWGKEIVLHFKQG